MSFRTGLAAGSITALAVSLLHLQGFRAEFQEAPFLSAWLLTSLLLGGISGAVGGLLAGRIPARWVRAAGALTGALFGASSYLLQVYLFMLYVFGNFPINF